GFFSSSSSSGSPPSASASDASPSSSASSSSPSSSSSVSSVSSSGLPRSAASLSARSARRSKVRRDRPIGGNSSGVTRTADPAAAPPDEHLLERHASGDRQALNELFRRHRGPAYRVAYRLLGNEADALDAVQEGFVKALTNLKRFEGRSSFKTWLLRVVSNAALDLGRQRGRREA